MPLIVIAILVLLAVLAARVEAAPDPDEPEIGENVDDTVATSIDQGGLVPGLAGTVAPGIVVPVPVTAIVPPIPIGELVQAAYRAAGVAHDPAPGWRVRSRLGGLVPWVSVRGGRDLTWREVDDPTLGHAEVFDVRATWHLDRLVFDPNELRIAAIDVSRRRERRRVAAVAIRAYHDWLALDVAARRSMRWALRRDEVAAELDAMTDGWFSDALARATPSGILSEQMAVDSILRTLEANVPGIRCVKILINGREVDTLAGHADLTGVFELRAPAALAAPPTAASQPPPR